MMMAYGIKLQVQRIIIGPILYRQTNSNVPLHLNNLSTASSTYSITDRLTLMATMLFFLSCVSNCLSVSLLCVGVAIILLLGPKRQTTIPHSSIPDR